MALAWLLEKKPKECITAVLSKRVSIVTVGGGTWRGRTRTFSRLFVFTHLVFFWMFSFLLFCFYNSGLKGKKSLKIKKTENRLTK